MSKRIDYIDTAKGILIVLVVLYHIPPLCMNDGVKNYAIEQVGAITRPMFDSFFMPAFFLISGFCTNFRKGIKDFAYKQGKTIIMPTISIGIIISLLGGCIPNLLALFNMVWYNWFIMALLISRTIYYVMANCINNSILKISISIFLLSAAVYIHSQTSFLNFGYFLQGLIAVFFICLGDTIKRNGISNCIYLVLSVAFVIGVTIAETTKLYRPRVVIDFVWGIKYIPFYIILSVCGSALCILLAKIVDNRYLRIMGTQSLIIFLVHPFFIHQLNQHLLTSIPHHSGIEGLMYFCILFVFTIGMSMGGAFLLNQKYLRLLIGKWQ